MGTGLATLPSERSLARARKGRAGRRVGTAVLLLFLLAGVTSLLGVRTGTVADDRGQVLLRVDYPQVTRAGLAVPYRVEVRRPGGFDGAPVRVAVSHTLFDRFDYQNFYPNPSAETADAEWVEYEFDPPDGEVLVWTFDVRTGPNQTGSFSSYAVQVRDAEGVVEAEVEHRVLVVP